MKINTKHLRTEKTASVFYAGNLRNMHEIWLVLHGYGQRADDFLKQFYPLEHKNRLIVAPEALNRFYLSGGKGKIGASWMTSRERENEIKDYINYIETLLKTIIANTKQKPEINVLGFSQGTATALRFSARTKRKIHRLVLWSGSIAPDINFQKAAKKFSNENLILIYGKNDKIFPLEVAKKEKLILEKHQIEHKFLIHGGEHQISPEMLIRCMQ